MSRVSCFYHAPSTRIRLLQNLSHRPLSISAISQRKGLGNASNHQPSNGEHNSNSLGPSCIQRLRSTAYRRQFSNAQIMASDDDYVAFLEKANQDTGASSVSAQSKPIKTRSVDTEVPEILQKVEEYYISDADEPFEPVSLKWVGNGLPSEDELANLIGHKHSVSTISQKEFDLRGQYTKLVETVKQAGSNDLGFFRAEHGSTRAEYYIVSLDRNAGKIVGLKAVAVES